MKIKILVLLLLTSLIVSANPFAKPSEPSGILRFNQTHPSANIFPVTLFEIDGKQIVNRNPAVWLKPGKHTIKVNSKIDLNSRSKPVISLQKVNTRKQDNFTLDIVVEDGKTYYVGYDTNDRDPNKWRPVLWKVK